MFEIVRLPAVEAASVRFRCFADLGKAGACERRKGGGGGVEEEGGISINEVMGKSLT